MNHRDKAGLLLDTCPGALLSALQAALGPLAKIDKNMCMLFFLMYARDGTEPGQTLLDYMHIAIDAAWRDHASSDMDQFELPANAFEPF